LGHIEGSHHVGRDEFLEKRNQIKSLMPNAQSIAMLLGNLGVTPETTVVAYAEDDNLYAARFVWTLRYHGHYKSFVLDGGYDKWVAEGRATAILPSADPQPVAYKLSEDIGTFSQARADAEYVYTRLQNPAVIIWDTRRLSEFEGTEVRADRCGHIPGAVHLDWTNLQTEVNGVKVLKSDEQIVKLLKVNGMTADHEVLIHCQTGIRSSYATLVLLGLGYEQVKNYDGSWFEWANNVTYPIVAARWQGAGSSFVGLK
jgi:thiosulfate/3-mercaptopyruvate sulfurtransferase